MGSLDDSEGSDDEVSSRAINTRGVGARGGLGIRYTFLKVLSVGFTPEFGYHYFFGGADEDLSDLARKFPRLGHAADGVFPSRPRLLNSDRIDSRTTRGRTNPRHAGALLHGPWLTPEIRLFCPPRSRRA